MENYAFVQALCEFEDEFISLMHSASLPVLSGNISVGWPFLDDMGDLAQAMKSADYLALHCYHGPTLFSSPEVDNSFTLFRYRRFAENFRAVNGRYPNLVLTETGVDNGVVKGRFGGWKNSGGYLGRSYTKRDYFNELVRLNEEFNKDPYLAFGLVYEAGPEGNWTSFEVDRELFGWLMDYARGLDGSEVVKLPNPSPITIPGGVDLPAFARTQAFDALGVPDNPTYALQRKAALLKLGAPLTGEYVRTAPDGTKIVLQVYALGYVWTVVGQYSLDQIKVAYL
jgi:hypothetical protein